MYVSCLPFKGKDVMSDLRVVDIRGTQEIQDTDSWAGTSAVIGTCQKFEKRQRH